MNSRSSRTAKQSVAGASMVAMVAVAATLLIAIILTALPASAQSGALPRADVVDQLGARYAEVQKAVGVTDDGGVIEVFATDDGSTWTLVLTKPDGTSRVIAAGEIWIKR